MIKSLKHRKRFIMNNYLKSKKEERAMYIKEIKEIFKSNGYNVENYDDYKLLISKDGFDIFKIEMGIYKEKTIAKKEREHIKMTKKIREEKERFFKEKKE